MESAKALQVSLKSTQVENLESMFSPTISCLICLDSPFVCQLRHPHPPRPPLSVLKVESALLLCGWQEGGTDQGDALNSLISKGDVSNQQPWNYYLETHLDDIILLTQNLDLHKICKWYEYTLKFEKQCSN